MPVFRHLAALLPSVALALLALPAHADSQLQAWREEAGRIRQLAENDTPRAYDAARQLQATLPANAAPVDQVRALNVLARVETYAARVEDADRHAQQARTLALEHGDKAGQAEADLNIALNSVNEGRIDKVRQAAVEALTLLDGANHPELLAEAMLRTVAMYMRHNQTSAAVVMAMQALDLARQSDNPRALMYANHAAALVQDQGGKPAPANEHYQRMLEHARTARSGLFETQALYGIAGTTNTLGDPPGAEALQKQAVALARQVGAPFTIVYIQYGLSEIYRQQGRYAEALALLDHNLSIYQRHPNKIGRWWTLNTRAGIQLTFGRLAAAAADAAAAHALAEEIGFPLYLAESGKRLATIAAAQGRHKQAYTHRIAADAMAKKAEQEKLSELILDMTERYQSEAKQRQIDDLTRRAAERSRQLVQLWTLLAATLVTLAITGYFVVRLRRSQTEIRLLNASLERRVRERTNELRQQTRYLRTLVDTLPLHVWLKDTEGRYLTVSTAGDTLKDRTVDEIIGRTDTEIWPGKAGESHRESDRETMAARRPSTSETCWIDASGERSVWVEVDKAPVIDEDGTVLGIVGVARDISARKSVETAREAALAEAERLAKARSTFLAQMSHELRTPLNGILGYTQTLLARPGLDERQRADLAIVWSSGEHLMMLIGDILDFAKIDAGKMELNPGDIRLDRFLAAIADLMQMRAERHGLDFIRRFADDLPAGIRADELRLRQVLLNLLSNAIKFTGPGGGVCLLADLASSGRLRFAIADSGVGIAPEHFETIFLPFEQSGDTRKRPGGTGLGLPISRAFVRLMGGDIDVDSQPGVGSTFRFEIDVDMLSEESLAAVPLPAPVAPPTITAQPPAPPIVAPPVAALEALHELALQGSMRDILDYADRLDEHYRGFAERLRALARQYRSRAIHQLIEQHLQQQKEAS